MIKDALDGKIDLILTKSVSRFARNTVDTLTTIRKLKERGVAVYFEEQSINTMDGKGELLITIRVIVGHVLNAGLKRCRRLGRYLTKLRTRNNIWDDSTGLPHRFPLSPELFYFLRTHA